jgi:beta-ureidopropionase
VLRLTLAVVPVAAGRENPSNDARGDFMTRTVRAALIQAHANLSKEQALEKHVAMVVAAADGGAEIACLQEIFHGPYFCAQQEPKWFASAEPDDGPTVRAMRELARRHELVLVVPFFEKEFEGVFYNTAVVIDADGEVRGKYRKTHIP